MDWGIKVLEGKWSEGKIKKAIEIVSDLIDQYEPNVLVIKKLHPARRTEKLMRLANKIKGFAQRKKLKVYQYSIKEIEKSLIEGRKLNKRNMIEALAKKYSALHYNLKKEQNQRNPYHFRMFEAAALATIHFNLNIMRN